MSTLTLQEAIELAVRHHKAGRLQEAIAAYHQTIAQYPDSAEAHNNLGMAYANLEQFDKATAAYRRAIELRPDRCQAWNNLGNALRTMGDLDHAIAAFERSLEIAPENAVTHNNLAATLEVAGQMDQSLISYRQAIALRPDSPTFHSNLVYALHFHPDYDAPALFQAHHQWSQRHADPLKQHIGPHANHRSPHRRLRIGYVSPDFRQHVVARFLLPLLAGHDHQRFEIFCYSNLDRPPDPMTRQIQVHADQWREIWNLPDEQAADLIRQDGIDILVDLTMHMAHNRLPLFARKPAPVQATYLAYCSTTGLDTIDYRLTDPYLDPPGQGDEHYSERSIRLPETYWCYQALAEAGDVTPLPALSTGHVTFGCLNNSRKVTPATLAAWRQLLKVMPQSHLLLHAMDGGHRQRIHDSLTQEGIDPQRVEFVGFVPLPRYFQLYQRIDIALDPFPYAGGTTSCDGLWMGVPMVTLAGQTAVGRSGVSILSNLGLGELIAHDTQQYIALASKLAGDWPRLEQLRSGLRQRLRQSPLMDAKKFAGDVEAAYRRMWRAFIDSGSA